MIDAFSMTEPEFKNISEILLEWYDFNRRDLPWRSYYPNLSDAYHVVLSEMMLQQTTVKTVHPYFLRFIERFPTLASLANSSLDEVYMFWQGLGYYRRARFLHEFSKTVLTSYQGIIPSDPTILETLPGIGPYSARAIAAIAFNKPTLGLDGNLIRVLGRIYNLSYSSLEIAKKLVPLLPNLLTTHRFSDYQQAWMDLGSSICRPLKPYCDNCPLKQQCLAYLSGTPESIPLKVLKPPIPQKYGEAFIILNPDQNKVILEFRKKHSLFTNLWGFPGTAWEVKKTHFQEDLVTVKHTFTHFKLELFLIQSITSETKELQDDWQWVHIDDLEKLAFPTLMRKVQKAAGLS